jgi:Sulfatase
MGAKGAASWASVALLSVAASCIPPREVDDTLRRSPETVVAPAYVQRAPESEDAPAVVLVVLDGVRWQDVFVGADPGLAAEAKVPAVRADELMPHLHALIADRGAALGAPGEGAPMAASGPNFVSLPGYTEIFSGRSPSPCRDNDCAPTRLPTLMDDMRAVTQRPSDVAVIASWEKIERVASADPSNLVLSTGRVRTRHAESLRDDEVTREWLERGARSDPFPGYDDFRPDQYTAAVGLRYLETKRPRLMFLGLGEPDEYAHRDDYAGYLGSLRAADAVIGELFVVLGRMGVRGQHTTVFVTADHGRGRDYRMHGRNFPESSRVWLVAAGAGVAARGFAHADRPHRLADIAPTVRTLLDLPPEVSPSSGTPLDELFLPPAERSAMQP